MRVASRFLTSALLGAALIAPMVNTGCAENHYYRVDDPYYHDSHRWDHDEDAAYHRWETETHRDHREYRQRNGDDQKAYWDWRHSHPGGDHDHDRH